MSFILRLTYSDSKAHEFLLCSLRARHYLCIYKMAAKRCYDLYGAAAIIAAIIDVHCEYAHHRHH